MKSKKEERKEGKEDEWKKRKAKTMNKEKRMNERKKTERK